MKRLWLCWISLAASEHNTKQYSPYAQREMYFFILFIFEQHTAMQLPCFLNKALHGSLAYIDINVIPVLKKQNKQTHTKNLRTQGVQNQAQWLRGLTSKCMNHIIWCFGVAWPWSSSVAQLVECWGLQRCEHVTHNQSFHSIERSEKWETLIGALLISY